MDTIKAPQTGRRIDTDLKAILGVLDTAPDHEGEVLYIRDGEIAFDTEENLFMVIDTEEE